MEDFIVLAEFYDPFRPFFGGPLSSCPPIHILLAADDFQVVQKVVGFSFVNMIYLHTFRDFTIERFPHKTMDISGVSLSVFNECYLTVATIIDRNSQNLNIASPVIVNTSYVPVAACLVKTFKTKHISPYLFHTITLRKYTKNDIK